jgi:bifunctional non-homologous end joining protein LigD
MATLGEYQRKRRFNASPEPEGKVRKTVGNRFVVQEHHARRLHYDFRLEVDGVLKSWAVPKGPSLNPADKRLAVQTEDHPLEYQTFEGVIPAGNYGAGRVAIWDAGTFEGEGSVSVREQIDRGELKFVLNGRKLRGSFVLVKLRAQNAKPQWLLIKHRDEFSHSNWKIDSGREVVDDKATTPRGTASPRSPVKKSSNSATPKLPAGARLAAMPQTIRPALASLTDRPFSDPDWLFEVKWDGVRTLAAIRDGSVRLWSRSNREITSEYPELSILPRQIDAREAWLDGEAVVLEQDGRSDFQRLQLRFSVPKPSAQLLRQAPVVYYLFDILFFNGYDLREVPLIERKAFLKRILRENSRIRYSDHVIEKGKELYALAVERKLEGLVAKKSLSPYPEGRSSAWLKIKLARDVDAVVGGWTDPRGSREYFGALLMGLYEKGRLEYISSVGTGFSTQLQKRIWTQLQELKAAKSPFADAPSTREKQHWLEPSLVARVQFSDWTGARHLRAPRFVGFQKDRDPKACTFEEQREQKSSQPAPSRESSIPPNSRPASNVELPDDRNIEKELTSGSADNASVKLDGRKLHLTNLNKVFFPEEGFTKRNLLAYYYRVAPFMLPFLKDRPLVLRRYPNGINGHPFFQKDAGTNVPDWVKTVSIRSGDKGRSIRYIVANDRTTLLYLTNLGCIDHNPWSSRYDDQEHPDYIFFDLDPTEGVSFAIVIKVARLIFSTLQELGFTAFAKTSGATGIHIFLPVEPRYSYEQARMFVQAVASIVDRKERGLITCERSVRKRASGTVYVDAHQNSRGQSLASVYSVRAFRHAPVSAPLKINELAPPLDPAKWNLKSMTDRLKKAGDLWAEFWSKRQSLEKLLRL